MPTSLTPYTDRAIARIATRRLDRTNALAAIAAEDIAALHEVGDELKNQHVMARLKSLAVEMRMPDLAGDLNDIDSDLLLHSRRRLNRLQRDL